MANFSASTYILVKAYTDSAIESLASTLSTGMTFKGHVATKADLPSTHSNGDLYIVDDADTSVSGSQDCKAVWSSKDNAWIYFDEKVYKTSQLQNDNFFLTQKVSGGSYIDNIHIDGSARVPTQGTTNPHEYIIRNIQFKRDKLANLNYTTPALGEPVFEYDSSAGTYKLKIGDGVHRYNALPYIGYQFELSADEQSVTIVNKKVQIYGFANADSGLIPVKDGLVMKWVNANTLINLLEGPGISIESTTTASGDPAKKLSVKVDNDTIHIDSNGKLYVSLDNDTITSVGDKLQARQPIAADNSVVVENIAGETSIRSNFRPGKNILFTTSEDGYIYIDGQAGGGGSEGYQAGTAIKFTNDPVTGNTIINADYDEGDYIKIITDPITKRTSINVDDSAVDNTVRPIDVNGVELLDKTPASGFLDFVDSTDSTAIDVTTKGETGGKAVSFNIGNKTILQAEEQADTTQVLKDLDSNYIVLDCGNANFEY